MEIPKEVKAIMPALNRYGDWEVTRPDRETWMFNTEEGGGRLTVGNFKFFTFEWSRDDPEWVSWETGQQGNVYSSGDAEIKNLPKLVDKWKRSKVGKI